eukprot:118220-Chlamydomonas_euryale.AAC.1
MLLQRSPDPKTQSAAARQGPGCEGTVRARATRGRTQQHRARVARHVGQRARERGGVGGAHVGCRGAPRLPAGPPPLP